MYPSPENPASAERVTLENLLSPRLILSLAVLAYCFFAVVLREAGGAHIALASLGGIVVLAVIAAAPVVVLIGVTVLRPLLMTIPEFEIGGLEIGIDGMINLAVIAGFITVLPLRKTPPWRSPLVWAWAGFLILGLITLPQSTSALFGFRQWTRMLGYAVFAWMSYSAVARNPDFTETLRRTVIAVMVLMLAMGAVQFGMMVGQLPVSEYVSLMTGTSLENRLDGFQHYPHAYAFMMIVCVLGAMWSFSRSENPSMRLLYALLTLAGLAAIVYTGVRSAFGAVLVALGVYLVGTRRYAHLALLVGLFLLVGLGSGVFQARFDDLVNPKRALEWDSLTDRRDIWRIVDFGIRQEPLKGHGLGSVNAYVGASPTRYSTIALSSHCDYRKFAFEMGIFGALFFVALFFATIWKAWRARASGGDAAELGSLVAAAGCALMTIAVVDEVMQDYGVMNLYWVLAGAALAGADDRVPLLAPRTNRHESTS